MTIHSVPPTPLDASRQYALLKGTSYERAVLARSEGLLPEIQNDLAKDPSVHVRVVLARHELDEPAQLLLAKDPISAVRMGVATHLPHSSDLLLSLTHDPDPDVRSVASARADLPERDQLRLAKDVPPLLSFLAMNPFLLPTVQRMLCMDPSLEVRSSLARNPVVDEDLLVLLTQDPSEEVLTSLAQNTSLSPALQLILWEGCQKYPGVGEHLARNPSLDPANAALLAATRNPRLHDRLVLNSSVTLYGDLLLHSLLDFRFQALRESLQHLSEPAQEAFDSLSENWNGTLNEILEALPLL